MLQSTSTMSHKDFAGRELKYAPVALGAVSKDGIFEGYASLFNTVDLGRDIVSQGAFRNSLRRQKPMAIKMLYQHDPKEPIGIWEVIREDHRGLYVKGRLLLDISRARDVHTLMQQGALDGLSIGFKTIRSRPQKSGSIRQLLEVDLYEISIVTFPMHPEARATVKKALPITSGLPTIRDFERWLMRDAGFTRRQAQTAIATGFKTLASKRDVTGKTNEGQSAANKIRRAANQLKHINKTIT